MKTRVKKHIEMLAAAAMLIAGMVALAMADGGFRFFGPLQPRHHSQRRRHQRHRRLLFRQPRRFRRVRIDLHHARLACDGPSGPAGREPGDGRDGCPTWRRARSSRSSELGRQGRRVSMHSGVYVYQIRAEGLTFSGTLLVVR